MKRLSILLSEVVLLGIALPDWVLGMAAAGDTKGQRETFMVGGLVFSGGFE